MLDNRPKPLLHLAIRLIQPLYPTSSEAILRHEALFNRVG
jgi:hypothetical protein